MEYPKVLIIGQYFELSSGGGITMSNLFKGWDKANISVIAERITIPEFAICDQYYQLGYNENKRRFPFNFWQKKEGSGPVELGLQKRNLLQGNSGSESGKMKIYNEFLHYSGLYHYTRKLRLSDELTIWIKEFSPKVIYTQLSSLELIEFVATVSTKFNLPIVIHIMDDWPSTISQNGFLKNFWHKKIDNLFRQLILKSKTLMSISDAMSEEYLIRYGRDFQSFHNPINIDRWVKHQKNSYKTENPFVILYAGRIGKGIQNCFLDVVKAVKISRLKGFPIEFHFQSTSGGDIIEELRKFDFVKIKEPVAYNKLPVVFSSVDVLLLPNDFDEESVSFLKYSMPTKASEYMATGTPILLYASGEIALSKHAAKYKWAYSVTENNIEKLSAGIEELYLNEDLRKNLALTATQFAVSNYSDEIVNENFRKAFTNS